MTEPTRSNFNEELPRLVNNIEEILPGGDRKKIDEVLERLKTYNGLNNVQQKIVQNFNDALTLRALLPPDDYLTGVVLESRLDGGAFGNVYSGKWNEEKVAVKKFGSVNPPVFLIPGDIVRCPTLNDLQAHIQGTFQEKFMQRVEPSASFSRELAQWKMVSTFDCVWRLLGYTMWLDQNEMTIVFALVSPLAEGYLKLSYMDRQSLEPKGFANYFLDVATGLQSLHEHGVVHGDIHAKNILRNNGRCYLVDFGISKFFDPLSSFSFAPAVANKQHVPELLDGSATRRNQSTDIFSFGSTMYMVLTSEILTTARGHPAFAESRLGQEWEAIWDLILLCTSEDITKRPTALDLAVCLKAI